VSRVGAAAQAKAVKKLAGPLKFELAQYRDLEAFQAFAADMDEETIHTLHRGAVLTELLQQRPRDPYPLHFQILLMYAGMKGFLDKYTIEQVKFFKDFLYQFSNKTNILIDLNLNAELNDVWFSLFFSSACFTFEESFIAQNKKN